MTANAAPAQDRLLSARRRLAEADRRRPWLLDGAVMAAVTALGLSDLNSGPDDRRTRVLLHTRAARFVMADETRGRP
jgi:hypothetical protein